MKPTLESIEQRNSKRLNASILDPVKVESVDDIRRVLDELDPAKNKSQRNVNVATTMLSNDDGKNVKYNVNANTKSKSKRDMLVEGFELIKKRVDVLESAKADTQVVLINGKEMKPASISTSTDSHSWVDPLVKQWTGGNREGLFITWDINDGYKYKYEIFSHKFTRVKK